jgi:hypothetical protein
MKWFIPPLAIAIFIGHVAFINAELIDNHDGTVTQIRDDGSRLMWMKDTNYADTSGYNQGGWFPLPDPMYPSPNYQEWIDYLNSMPNLTGDPPGYAGFNDWRIPSGLNRDGSDCYGYDCSETELGYMYYIELGNSTSYTGEGLTNVGPFESLVSEYPENFFWDSGGWFNFHEGLCANCYTCRGPTNILLNKVWPVRDMEPIQLPEPPKANAGADQMVFDEITLDGSKSIDSDGRIVSYEWHLKHQWNAAFSKNASGITPTVSGLEPGYYGVFLTVTDNDGATDTDTLKVAAIGRKGDLNLDGDIDGDDLSEFADVFGGSN